MAVAIVVVASLVEVAAHHGLSSYSSLAAVAMVTHLLIMAVVATTTVVVREILVAVTADADVTNLYSGGAFAPPIFLYIIILSYFPALLHKLNQND